MIKLSIVIPYYDTYDLTIKLLKELEIQVTPEVEVILVDDGCHEERFDKFTFAKIIHLEKNYGATTAWNTGIKQATGKYIAFIDSDDMIMMNYVDELLKVIDERDDDVITFNFIDVEKKALSSEVMNRLVFGIWKGIYKREICPLFRTDWKYRSDVPFQHDLKAKNPTVSYLDKILYVYSSGMCRKGSLTWKRKMEDTEWVMPQL